MNALESQAVLIINILLWTLGLLYLFLALYTASRRFVKKRVESLLAIASSEIEPRLHQYLIGELSLKEMEACIEVRYEIVAAFRLINPMIDTFEGEEREKLLDLYEFKAFRDYFRRRLNTDSVARLAQTCVYYAQKRSYEPEIARFFLKVLNHDSAVLAYSAALALLNHSDAEMRRHALTRFVQRRRNSSMAIHDVVVKFVKREPRMEQAAAMLFELAMRPETPPRSAASVILLFPELGFLHMNDELFLALVQPVNKDNSGRRTAALITVLAEMMHPDILLTIKLHRWHESSYRIIQQACLKAFASQGESIPKDVKTSFMASPDAETRFLAEHFDEVFDV